MISITAVFIPHIMLAIYCMVVSISIFSVVAMVTLVYSSGRASWHIKKGSTLLALRVSVCVCTCRIR